MQPYTAQTSSAAETPSFVCELPLRVSPVQEKILLARLEAARQLYNACLGEAMKRLRLVQQSRLWQKAQKAADKNLKSDLVREARSRYGFTDAALQRYAVKTRRSWIGEHLDVHTAQKLATRAYRAAERVLSGEARGVRFKGKNQLDTVEGKSNAAGIRWRNGCVVWKGLVLPAVIDPEDPVVQYALSCRVKYVRLVRRKVSGRNRFYVQLVLEGTPYRKPKNVLGKGAVGLDAGPSTVARVNGVEARLDRFCEELADKEAEIKRLQRRLDRSRRANNPDNYNPDGTVKKGPKNWRKSKTYLKTQARLAEMWRKTAAHRKSLIGRMVNETLRMGDVFKFEKLSYRALQRMFGRSVGTRSPGRYFRELARKAESAGGEILEFPTRLGLSSRCHCGARKKKALSERWHICSCGAACQRDLYSAYLARFVEKDGEDFRLDAGSAARQWPGAEQLLQAASGRTPNSRVSSPAGQPPVLPRGTEGVAAEERAAKAEARDAVAPPSGGGESPGKAAMVPSEPPGFSHGEAQAYGIKDETVLLVLSPVGFFDLVTTNLSFFPGNIRNIGPWKRILSWTMLPKYHAVISERQHLVLGHFDPKAPDLFRRTIANRRLANAVALSLNILDARGRALIAKRPRSITVAAEAYAVAVTGTLTEADLAGTAGNVLTRGAAREAREELGLSVDPEKIRLFDIVLTRQKYQPIALLELEIDGEIEKVAEFARHGEDFSAEVGRLYALDLRNPKEFFSVTCVLPFSPASLYSLERAFARINSLTDEDLRRHKRQHRPSPALARRWEKQPLLSVEP